MSHTGWPETLVLECCYIFRNLVYGCQEGAPEGYVSPTESLRTAAASCLTS